MTAVEPKRKYEGLIVLNTKGREDSVEKIISSIGNIMEEMGAKLEQIDQLGRRKFAYPSQKLDEGFYVNYHFEADPGLIEDLREKLELNKDVHIQQYQRR
ncbi:hypothetical protein BH23VER1_BH23VER1_36700 [soil metagenome]